MRKKFGVLTFGRGSPTERELKSATYQVPVRLSEISAEQYRERVAQACEFLEGKSREMIATLEEEMRKAAKKWNSRKAAELRNMIGRFAQHDEADASIYPWQSAEHDRSDGGRAARWPMRYNSRRCRE